MAIAYENLMPRFLLPGAFALMVAACGSSSTPETTGTDAGSVTSSPSRTAPCEEGTRHIDPSACGGQLLDVDCNYPAATAKTVCKWSMTFECGLPAGVHTDAGTDAGAGVELSVEQCNELCAAGPEYPKGVPCSAHPADAGAAVQIACGAPVCGG